MNTQQAAQALASFLTIQTRNNGDRFVCKTDDAPDWVADLIRTVHGDLFPDDWTYQTISECADAIAEGSEQEPDADIYTRDLIKWLGSYPDALGACDEATEEYGAQDSIDATMRQGQQYAISRIYLEVSAALEAYAEEQEEDAE